MNNQERAKQFMPFDALKRIFAVLLLIVIMLTVGYLRFTGSRLSSNFDGDDYEEVTFEETNTDYNTDIPDYD